MAKLVATERTGNTQSSRNELRNTGKVPAILYGYKVENTSVAVDENEFIKVIREVGRNGVIELELESKTTQVMVNDYQFDSLKNKIEHIDFIAINMDIERTVDVNVVVVGEAAGANEGGVVEQPNFTVQVTARPADLPEEIEIDVTDLEVGSAIHVGDIRDNFKFTIEDEDDFVLATCHIPAEEPEEDEDTEEAVEGEEEPKAEAKEASEEE